MSELRISRTSRTEYLHLPDTNTVPVAAVVVVIPVLLVYILSVVFISVAVVRADVVELDGDLVTTSVTSVN